MRIVGFFAYYGISSFFTFAYFFLGAFASAMFTNIVYCRVTRKERMARGETFGEHCRTVAGWPTLSIICSLVASYAFWRTSHSMIGCLSSGMDRFTFFALAPIAVFTPIWIYLIRRYRQKAAMEGLHRKFAERHRQRDTEFLRNQGIIG